MSEAKTEVKVPTIKQSIREFFTPRVLITWLITLAIALPFMAFRIYGIYGAGGTMVIIYAFIALMLSKFSSKFKYTIAELALLFATCQIITDVALWAAFWPYCGAPFAPIYGGSNWAKVKNLLPSWFFPPTDVLNLARKGGQAFPWAAWAPTLTFLILLVMFSLFLQLAIATFWAYRWIVVERLPFPAVMANIWFMRLYEQTIETDGKRRTALVKNLWFWVGFIPAFIMNGIALMEVYSEAVMHKVYIKLPASTGFIGQFVIDLRFLSPYLPGARLYWYPGLDFGWLGLNLFMPVDVLATAIIWWVFWYIIWPAIVNTTGLVGTKVSWGWLAGNPNSPFPFGKISGVGIIFGFSIALIVYNWRYIKDMIVSAFGRETTLAKELKVKGIPPSWIVGLAIISGVVLIILWALWSVPVPFLIIWTIFVMMYLAGHARVISEAGWHPEDLVWDMKDIGFGLARAMYGWPNPCPTPAAAATAICTRNFAWPTAWREVPGIGAWGLVMNYRMAEEAKLSWRTMFIAQIITIVVISILCWPAVYAFAYWKGVEVRWSGYVTGIFIRIGARRFTNFVAQGSVNPWTPWTSFTSLSAWSFIGGTIITLVLLFLRLRFPWFFFNPVGIALGANAFVWLMGTAIIALIVKLLVIKIGGAAAYEKYLAPFAAGWAIGYGVASIVFYWPEQVYRAIFNKIFAWFWW